MPPKVTPGSITKTADAQESRINNISNVSSAISNMQKDVDQKIAETQKEVKSAKSISQVHESMNQTLGGLNKTIGALTSGVAKITADTARATADAVKQYGRAISQDISFNKKSVVSMALAQTSPLYGYFVAKFMETDVFKKALTRMKVAISQTIGAIVRPLKGRGGVKGGAEIPHMQTGGHVQQGGMAKLHAGETVVPSGGDLSAVSGTLQEMLQVQKRQALYMRSVFGVWSEVKPGILKKMIAPFTIPFKIIKMFRKTKGRYVSHLSKSGQPLENISQNIQTLYMGLMWRLDNMLNVMVANTEATRDLSAFVTKTKYAPIPSVSSKVPAFSLIRTITKMALRPITGPLEFLSKGMFGDTGLTKKRGLYRKEPGLMSSLLGKITPEGRREALGERGRRGKIARGGELGGPGNQLMSMTGYRFARVLARVQSKLWSGTHGKRNPIWVVSQYTPEQATAYGNRLEFLKSIRDSNEEQADMERKARKEAKKEGMFKRIMGWLKLGLGFVGSIFKVAAMGAIAAALGVAIGVGVKKWLDSKFDFSTKMQDFLFHNESTAKGINNLVSKEAERAHKAMQSLRAGEMTAGAAHTQVQISKRYQGIKKTSGALAQRGTIYAAEVQSGMQSYMANHMSSYLNYDSQGIADARNQWLKSEKSGSWLSKKWENVKSVANANELGRELEKRFRGHMIKTMTPLSDAQRAAPKSYQEEYEKGIKGRNLSPAEEAKARKLNIEAEIRSRKTMGLSEASKALAGGATSAEVRANVRTRFLESLATVIAGERGGTKKGYMGMAGQIYDQIAETAGLNSPLLSDYNKVFSLGTQILDKRKEATGWLGSYTPSVVAEHVSKEIKKYNKGLPTNITAMDPRARHMMESGTASMASATIATNEVKMVASTVKIGSTPLEQKLDQITNDITKTTEKAAGAVVISQYENNIIQTDNRSNSTSTGGASAPFFSGDHITELNKSGNLH